MTLVMGDVKALVNYGWGLILQYFLFVMKRMIWKLMEYGILQAPQTGGHGVF